MVRCRSGFIGSVLIAGWFVMQPVHAKPLRTLQDNQIGLRISDYKYTEPGLMSLKATKVGIDYTGDNPIGFNGFLSSMLSYATGKADYTGSGHKNNNPDWFVEVAVTGGRDYLFRRYTLSPYVGFGFRYLFNDTRGQTDTGYYGYRRESRYWQLPVGVRFKTNLGVDHQLLAVIEGDYLLRGRQDSRLSDLVGYDDVVFAQIASNKQTKGYGLRASIMYSFGKWSVGPTATYWHIDQSRQASTWLVDSSYIYKVIGVEPKNNTRDTGIRAAFHF